MFVFPAMKNAASKEKFLPMGIYKGGGQFRGVVSSHLVLKKCEGLFPLMCSDEIRY